MKNIATLFLIQFISLATLGQARILPGDSSIDKTLIKPGQYTMGYYVVKEGQATEICVYERQVAMANQKINIKTQLNFLSSDLQWTEDIVIDENTFKPISRKSGRDTRSFTLQFSERITGDITDHKTAKSNPVNFPIKEKYFDIATYPYVLCALPLNTGYKATIPVIDYDAKDKNKIHNVVILEVKSHVLNSELTGDHNVWKVSVSEESTGNMYNYYIDKDTHKLWRVDIAANGNVLFLRDKETEFNPFKNKFDKKEMLKMVSGGNSIILGEAYAREGMLDINLTGSNKKQLAPKGTKVLLMPYTDYYKEWFEINKKQAKVKNAKPIPLPNDAKECIIFTEVYDHDGHFEFTGLMPGEYLLFAAFGYEETFLRRETTGGANVYINGQYAGSEVYSDVFQYARNATANAMKTVTISKNGETLDIKLRNSVKFKFFK
jgi:hypothetical protein